MYRQGGSRAEMWRLKSVPPVAFNQERPNLRRDCCRIKSCVRGRLWPQLKATHPRLPERSSRDARLPEAREGGVECAKLVWSPHQRLVP